MLTRLMGTPLRSRGFVRASRSVLVMRAKGPGGKKKDSAKEKKVFVPPWKPEELPKEPVARLAFAWERVMAPGTKEDISVPWKKGEEPEWVNTLLMSQTDFTKMPPEELDPKVVGYGYKAKRKRTESIKLKNFLLSKGNFRVLGKPSRRKQTAP